ncbi:MAG: ABC transporter ATP-binding protein/permease [Lachnospiraceae bacterium]|nr:ABC transporter ATP-binding protein/permease [Lachnospiraceae bacterium]
MKIFKKLMVLLDARQKRSMVGLIFLMLIGAVFEAFSVVAIIPVIQIILVPNAIQESEIMWQFYEMSPFTNLQAFGVAVMILLIIAFVFKNTYIYFEQKILYRFIYSNQFSTSERMMKNFIKRDYEYFLNADTAVIQRTITSDVNNMYALILSLLQLASEAIVFVTIAAVLLFTDPLMTVLIAVLLLITLAIIKVVLKPQMYKAGKDNQDYYSSLFKWISQTIMGIKEVKIGGRENYFVDEYNRCGKGYVGAVQKYTLLNNIPRLVIECVCVTGMVIYFIYLYLFGSNNIDVLATLAAFGLGLARLMPSANRINNQLNNIDYFKPFFMGVSDNLQDEIDAKKTDVSSLAVPDEKLPVKDKITLDKITYRYPNTEKYIFKDASLEISVGSAIGIVGVTGSGKSTMVDILLGLLKISDGHIFADGVDVFEGDNYRKWLKNVGYIPQTIFMLDDTIRKNVAFGVPEDEIDEDRVWEVLKEAQLDEFVKSLPEGLDAGIGERGIRISGGQRQRIGIARALYDDPEVLVLDEATSALDDGTEKAIVDSINRLHGSKTLVIVAHRLQTIEKCDAVYRVENGSVTKER